MKLDVQNEINELNKHNWSISLKPDEIRKIQNLNCDSPSEKDIFNAFKIGEGGGIIAPTNVNVLILGQDPYPSKGKNKDRAHGFAFSFGNNAIPADDSLLNIYIAIAKYRDSKGQKGNNINKWKTNLKPWAKNNRILLLNTALTYCDEIKKEDRIAIWKPFVEKIIENLLVQNENCKLVVFLWGDDAKLLFHKTIFDDKNKSNTKNIIGKINRNLLVLSTSHPSDNYFAFKRGFCYEAPNHFQVCDEFIGKIGGKYIWKDFPENNQ